MRVPGDATEVQMQGRHPIDPNTSPKQLAGPDFDVGTCNKPDCRHSQPPKPRSTDSKEGDDDDDPEVPDSENSVEDRLQYLLDCAQQVGFDDFDAALSAYYTVKFTSTSPLVLEQRMSRVRRLPNLLADLRHQAPTWRPREQRGYQDEVVKAAEEVCAKEYKEFLSQIRDGTKQSCEIVSHDGREGIYQSSLEEEVRTFERTYLKLHLTQILD